MLITNNHFHIHSAYMKVYDFVIVSAFIFPADQQHLPHLAAVVPL